MPGVSPSPASWSSEIYQDPRALRQHAYTSETYETTELSSADSDGLYPSDVVYQDPGPPVSNGSSSANRRPSANGVEPFQTDSGPSVLSSANRSRSPHSDGVYQNLGHSANSPSARRLSTTEDGEDPEPSNNVITQSQSSRLSEEVYQDPGPPSSPTSNGCLYQLQTLVERVVNFCALRLQALHNREQNASLNAPRTRAPANTYLERPPLSDSNHGTIQTEPVIYEATNSGPHTSSEEPYADVTNIYAASVASGDLSISAYVNVQQQRPPLPQKAKRYRNQHENGVL